MARVRIDAELGADDDALAALLGGEEGPRRTVEPVAIADADRPEPELLRAHDELFGPRSAAQERERGREGSWDALLTTRADEALGRAQAALKASAIGPSG